jgi:hypothetical protein
MYEKKNYVIAKYLSFIKRNILAFFISLTFTIINLKNKFNEKRRNRKYTP